MPITCTITDGIAEIVMDNPPVNALTVAGWFELGEVITRRRLEGSLAALPLTDEVGFALSALFVGQLWLRRRQAAA